MTTAVKKCFATFFVHFFARVAKRRRRIGSTPCMLSPEEGKERKERRFILENPSFWQALSQKLGGFSFFFWGGGRFLEKQSAEDLAFN